ncbi:MAG: ribonuclease HII [Betaproteobacteria bacterium RIFCSPHIGHO2_12_FULL_69_13]|nr:MAG: ribonuclease HII [Betaproteobacteria bacterium RIFCSPHIGHO2_12_FULL_69_13]OGA67252.1 MAG: ribonuclease HII [Betaproteobacteria bacterium RIFCSPLOWO2_12_FULL_68_20]
MRRLLVCGVDEAGKGPLAGPVYAAAVILDSKRRVRGLADSKVLAPERREVLAGRIKERAVAWAVAAASVEEIDRLNIFKAGLLAMQRAVESLNVAPEEVWVDGTHCPELRCRARAIVDGDALHPVISAASILAKTARDALMCELHERYPQYGFERHKGYATPEHLEALARFGPCEIHRRTFRPVRAFFEDNLFGDD